MSAVPEVARAGGVEGGVERKEADRTGVDLPTESSDVRATLRILYHAGHIQDFPVVAITETVDGRVAWTLWAWHLWPRAVARPPCVVGVLQLLDIAVGDVQMVP